MKKTVLHFWDSWPYQRARWTSRTPLAEHLLRSRPDREPLESWVYTKVPGVLYL